MPRAMSCRPRWAIGRAVSQSVATMAVPSLHLEQALDLDRGVERQHRDTDGGTRVPPLVAEQRDHQVGGAVHDFWPIEEGGIGIDEAAEAHHAGDLLEIAERGL